MRKFISVVTLLLSSASVAVAEQPLPLEIKGTLTQGALILAKSEPGVTATLNGEPLEVTSQGYIVFGFPRKSPLENTLVVTKNGNKVTRKLTLESRDYKIDRVNGVPQKTVTPDPAQIKRARKEAEKVWLARQTKTTRTDFLTPVVKPAEGRISGVYGSQRIFNGEPRNPHYGEDIAGPTGTPVKAPWPGNVVLAEPDLFYSGGTIIIEHGYKITTTYLHLSELHVEVGDKVQQGDSIGEIGATGRATGPHLDWRVNWGNERLDPALLPQLYQN
ncbi:M23 family metallopeptidase [Idiomarina sp. HP20-50]|uniref:M23 family metallopeptidase n=1 Tax=Idiomarina sp. HP20-50 TaxID=3070813 RepID=UPI00294AAC77|nr:M23 family metallopeptidase [Idiomarina sp. HP20-50]MDV6315146.1 M23 family metallopeptidase [Idiomarina sp. HP20-50]